MSNTGDGEAVTSEYVKNLPTKPSELVLEVVRLHTERVRVHKAAWQELALHGAGSKRGVSRSGLVLHFLPFFVFFWALSDLSGIFPVFCGNFPEWSFSSFSAYESNSKDIYH